MNWTTFRRVMLAVSTVAALSPMRAADAAKPEVLALEGDLSPIHDPAMARDGDNYYVFATNRYQQKDVPIFCSADLHHWKFCGNVFDGVPAWALKEIPGARGIWAPDVKFVRGEFRLYYSVSTFGSNVSVIGLTTNKTLNPASPDYKWVDQGLVFASKKEDDFNAIDPNLAVDQNGDMWMSFGSFWSGIKMRKIDPKTGKLASDDTTLYSLASRPRSAEVKAEIEAPFIVRRDNYYYLFVSFDRCCRGANSTYKTMVGRSDKITGPYVDKAGKAMMDGGGTLLIEGNESWKGPGGGSVVQDTKGDFYVFHTYDGTNGRSFLQISTMVWENGWPRVGSLPAPAKPKP